MTDQPRQPDHTPTRPVRIPDDLLSRARQSPEAADASLSLLVRAGLVLLAAATGRAVLDALAEAGKTTDRKGLGAGRPRQTPRPHPQAGNR